MHLADNEYTFYCKVKGDKTHESFEGDFTVACILNQEQMVDVAIRTERYNASQPNLAVQYKLINRAIAEMEVRIVRDKKTSKPKCPSWWQESDSGRLLYDTNVVFHVFSEAMKAEEVYAKKLSDKAEAAEKTAEAQAKKEAE